MSKIILNIDKPDEVSKKDLISDISLLRDHLVTISREYHAKGYDKFDDLNDRFSQVRTEVIALAKVFDDLKKEFYKLGEDNTAYLEQTKGLYHRATEYSSQLKTYYESTSGKLDKIDGIINSAIDPLNYIDINKESFESLVMRVSKVIQKMSELDKIISEIHELEKSKSVGLIAKIKKLFSNGGIK